MKRLLKKTGSIYVHCDWHASHYIKVEMDKVFGHDNFRNELIWSCGAGGVSRHHFPRKHDVLLGYSRDAKPYFNTDGKLMRVPYGRSTLDTRYKKMHVQGRQAVPRSEKVW